MSVDVLRSHHEARRGHIERSEIGPTESATGRPRAGQVDKWMDERAVRRYKPHWLRRRLGDSRGVPLTSRHDPSGAPRSRGGAVVDPFARCSDPLAGGDDGGMAHDGHQIAVAARLRPGGAQKPFSPLWKINSLHRRATSCAGCSRLQSHTVWTPRLVTFRRWRPAY